MHQCACWFRDYLCSGLLLAICDSWLLIAAAYDSIDHITAFINYKIFLNSNSITLRFDFWSAYWHEPIKNKNKNRFGLTFDLPIGTSRSKTKTKTKVVFSKWFLDVKNGSTFEFWRQRGVICSFSCFWSPIPVRGKFEVLRKIELLNFLGQNHCF